MKSLDSIAKRDLLASERFNADDVRAYGDDYYEAGRYGEAFSFYSKAKDVDGVRRVMEASICEGEPDVLWSIERAWPDVVSAEDWNRCGENAMRMGKFRAAAYVFERTGNADALAEAEKAFKPTEEAAPTEEAPVSEE